MRNMSAKEIEYALNNAIASVEIEGYSVSDDERNMCMEFLGGNITKEQFIEAILERCRS